MASNSLEDSDTEEEESPDKLAEHVAKTGGSKQSNGTHLSRSFFEMRPSRLSGASNASSLDSSHSATASDDTQTQPQQQQKQKTAKGSAIEILSSDEDEEDEDEESDSKDSDSKLPQFRNLMPSAHARELRTMELNLKSQEVKLYFYSIIEIIFSI